MTFWRLFYHIVWATKNRDPLIPVEAMPSLHSAKAAKATQMGASVHAVGGVEDHVHIVASVPPTLALTEFIRQMKGSSSHFANHQLALSSPFNWQSEYGVLSFDGKLLDKVVQYVKDQQAHHQYATTI